MTDAELVHRLYRMSRVGVVNHQEGILLREAAQRIDYLSGLCDRLEERVAIMMDGNQISRERLEQMVTEAHDAENAGRNARGDGHSGGGHRDGGQGGRD